LSRRKRGSDSIATPTRFRRRSSVKTCSFVPTTVPYASSTMALSSPSTCARGTAAVPLKTPAHIATLLERRAGARGPKRRVRIAELSDECRIYLQEIARRRISLENEVRKLDRLIAAYGETDVVAAIAQALAARTFGANHVRAFADQRRFARGLGEPPEPVITGNKNADDIIVEPHNLETYDALFQNAKDSETCQPEKPSPTKTDSAEAGDRHATDGTNEHQDGCRAALVASTGGL